MYYRFLYSLVFVVNSLKPATVKYTALVPKTKVDNIFTRHTYDQILDIFTDLNDYSQNMINQTQGIDKRVYQGMATNLRNGKYYASKMKDNSTVYLGWTPLQKDSIMIKYSRPKRNDNENISFRKVPLYFIFLEPKDKKLSVTRIIRNPSIDMRINIQLIRKHLEELAELSNTELNLTPLMLYDSGRWYFEFCYNYNLTQMNLL